MSMLYCVFGQDPVGRNPERVYPVSLDDRDRIAEALGLRGFVYVAVGDKAPSMWEETERGHGIYINEGPKGPRLFCLAASTLLAAKVMDAMKVMTPGVRVTSEVLNRPA